MLRLRGVVAALAVTGVCGAVAACGAASASASGVGGEGGTPAPDSGSELDSTTTFDGQAESGTVDGAADAAPPLQTGALFVHASPDLPDLRLCWKIDGVDGGAAQYSNVDVPFPSVTPAPASNYPAMPVGGVAALADASSLVGSNLTIVGIPASAYFTLEAHQTPPLSCATVLGSGAGSIIGVIDTYTFTVPAGIVAGSTSVIALAGCPANDANGSPARCGAGWTSASGNLHVDVLPLYPVSASGAGQLPVQAGQLSAGLAQLAGDAGAVVSFGPQGATTPIGVLTREGSWAPPGNAPAYLDAGTDPSNYGTLGFGVDVVGTDGGPGHLWMSLEQSLELIDPMMNPAVYYIAQDTYIVAVIGDPNGAHPFAPDASFDGTGLHILVIPL